MAVITDNYEITRIRTQDLFLKYDQGTIIQHFGLESDEDYIYLNFIGRPYRVERRTGEISFRRGEEWTVASFNDSMTIYDVLCDAKPDAKLAGSYCLTNSLKGVVKTGSAGVGEKFFDRTAQTFAGRLPELEAACRAVGGTNEIGQRIKGDLVMKLPLFDFLWVVLQFWDADDEFPASLTLMWDENVQDFMRYETTYYAASFLYRRLLEEMGEAD